MLIDQWNREGQDVMYNDSGNWTEAHVDCSRATLGGRIMEHQTKVAM